MARQRVPGVHSVVLYSAPGCHLCEEARRGLQLLAREIPFVFSEIDIHSDAELEKRWLLEIPVVEVNGAVTTQAPVDLDLVRRALRGR